MFTIFVGGLHMEVNSFNLVLSTTQTFTTFLEGPEIDEMRSTSLELGGVYTCLEGQDDVRMVPGFFAQACTSGPLQEEDFESLCQKILCRLGNADKVDAVLLVLHGAMQSEHTDDCEGYLIRKVRELVGEEVPISASFDLHARITAENMGNLDAAAGYLTYPHVDHFETGKRAAESLLYLLRNRVKPYKICRRIPLIMSCENSNTIDSPIVPVIQRLKTLLEEDGVLSGSLFLTQPWLDSPAQGCSICIFAEDTDTQKRAHIEKTVEEMLASIWEQREVFYPPMPDVQQALHSLPQMQQPVFLVDYGDVPNAGGIGDSTVMLKALLDSDMARPSVVVVADAESTQKAAEVGVGYQGDFQIGGFGRLGEYNQKVLVKAEVLRLETEPYIHFGPPQKGYINRPGMRALLRCGNVYIILLQRVSFSHDRNTLLSLGLKPADMGVVVMKSTHTFLYCYEGCIGSWMYVDTPGASTRNLKTLDFRHCQRPIYPLDRMATMKIIEVI